MKKKNINLNFMKKKEEWNFNRKLTFDEMLKRKKTKFGHKQVN